MGVTFRSGDYIRHVFLGGRTIKDGEAAAVWNLKGEHRQIIGPKRIFLFSSTIRFLTRYKAEPNQYFRVNHRDGTVEHIQGPTQTYMNPSYHDQISVHDGIQLKENEVIRVCHMPMLSRDGNLAKDIKYNANGSIGKDEVVPLAKASKRDVYGPTLFIPAEDEVVEEFHWSVLPSDLDGGLDVYKNLQPMNVTKVALHTKRVWSVKVSIGSETSKLNASLAISYKIRSMEKIALHNDPYAFVCASLMADIQELFQEQKGKGSFTSDFEALQGDITSVLSRPEALSQLVSAGETIGFDIQSVKVLEVYPGRQLQLQIDEEHKRSLEMKAQVANKESEIKFQELELEERRKKLENKIELSRKEAKMKAELAEEVYLQEMAALDRESQLTKKREQQRLDSWRASDEVVVKFLGNLKELGVDMSAYMCATGSKKVTADVMKRAPSLFLSPSYEKEEGSEMKQEMAESKENPFP